MTSRPSPSHFIHSGFNDLITLVASTPSRLGVNLAASSRFFVGDPTADGYGNGKGKRLKSSRTPSPDEREVEDEFIAVRYEDNEVRRNIDPESQGLVIKNTSKDVRGEKGGVVQRGGKKVEKGKGRESGAGKGGDKGNVSGTPVGNVQLIRRKVDKRMISAPKDFRHIFHASTYEEATELLLRWSIEGVGDKLGDPSWAYPIKELVKARARQQQAIAVAAVVDATIRSRMGGDALGSLPRAGALHVVNGLPSSIYSTVNTAGHTANRPPTLLFDGSTPNLIANFAAGNYFERIPSGLRTPTSPLVNPFATPVVPQKPPSPVKEPVKPPIPPRKITGLQIKKRSNPPPALPGNQAGQEVASKLVDKAGPGPTNQAADPATEDPLDAILREISAIPIPSSTTNIVDLRKTPKTSTAQQPISKPPPLPFRIVKPSLPTLEKAMSIALFFEQYYHALLKPPAHPQSKAVHPGNYLLTRARRLAALEDSFALPQNRFMSEGEKERRREELMREENRALRERRRKVDVRAFEVGRVIGHGAFGVVRIARERSSGRLVAMKQLRKADMLRKSQEGHVKAEKDLLAAAASQSLPTTDKTPGKPSWIVKLHYAFQDVDNLYLVLEYMGGGDLLNLLVDRDIFPEPMTKFYIAEMILALEETHSLGYIHRDIKPDNFLFTPSGHIRVSDFGLATDLHWAHDTGYYEQQRLALLKKHGIDLEDGSGGGGGGKTRRLRKEEIERVLGKEWVEEGKGLFTWRDKNRKNLAYSVCGTNSYMAPEVIRGLGYGFSCDWWSLGVIMYESLYGYPPFVSSSRHVTRQKILNWKTSLKFPPHPRLSKECTDLMTKLLCEPEDRLGATENPKSILSSGTNSILLNTRRGSSGTSGTFSGLGNDGAGMLKKHDWFKGIDWDSIHLQDPPYHPNLKADDDTRHFDDDIPNEPLAAANGQIANSTKDPLLNNKTHGAHLLEIRKSLAFKGWTFKAPSSDYRFGLPYISDLGHEKGDSESTIHPEIFGHGYAGHEGGGGGGEDGDSGTGTVRARALSV